MKSLAQDFPIGQEKIGLVTRRRRQRHRPGPLPLLLLSGFTYCHGSCQPFFAILRQRETTVSGSHSLSESQPLARRLGSMTDGRKEEKPELTKSTLRTLFPKVETINKDLQ